VQLPQESNHLVRGAIAYPKPLEFQHSLGPGIRTIPKAHITLQQTLNDGVLKLAATSLGVHVYLKFRWHGAVHDMRRPQRRPCFGEKTLYVLQFQVISAERQDAGQGEFDDRRRIANNPSILAFNECADSVIHAVRRGERVDSQRETMKRTPWRRDQLGTVLWIAGRKDIHQVIAPFRPFDFIHGPSLR